MSQVIPITITKFLGKNENPDGETGLKLGEASVMSNYRITDNNAMKVVDGYVQMFASIAAKSIQGQWYGEISGTKHHLFACNGHVYKHNLSTHGLTDLGALTDDITSFFMMDNAVYISNGDEYYKWTGTGSIAAVTGYRPLVAIGAPPTGGGTLQEANNLLTGAKHMMFIATAGATEYTLLEQDIDSVDFVNVNGTDLTPTTDYTSDLTTGKVTFVIGSTANDIVDIGWTNTISGERDVVVKNRYPSFFGANSERLFLWGDGNTRIHSGLPIDLSTSAEYFEAGADDYIGPGDSITGILGHGDRQIIYGSTWAKYSYQEDVTVSGVTITTFPVKDINEGKGNVAVNQAKLIVNNPYAVYKGFYQWIETEVKDKRNAIYMSSRIQPSLDAVDLTTAITFDYETLGEYWLCVGKTIQVYKYRNDTFFQIDLPDTPTNFIEIEGVLYFGTTNGQIMKFDPAHRSFNGTNIIRNWEMGFNDCGDATRQKNTDYVYVSLKPEVRSGVYINFETNKNARGMSTPKKAVYNFATFLHQDFNHYSFKTNYNPQPFPFQIKALGFAYIKFKLYNDSNVEVETILLLSFPVRFGGRVR